MVQNGIQRDVTLLNSGRLAISVIYSIAHFALMHHDTFYHKMVLSYLTFPHLKERKLDLIELWLEGPTISE